MDDDFIDDFAPEFPLWFVARRDQGLRGMLTAKSANGNTFALLFTDNDLAMRELDTSPVKDNYEPRTIDGLLHLFGALLKKFAMKKLKTEDILEPMPPRPSLVESLFLRRPLIAWPLMVLVVVVLVATAINQIGGALRLIFGWQ